MQASAQRRSNTAELASELEGVVAYTSVSLSSPFSFSVYTMCGASVNPAPALSAATVFNLISLLCCAIAAGAPWYTYKSNSSSGTLSVGLFSFTSDKLILKSDGSFWSGPVSYKEYYDNVLSSACASAVSAVTCTAFKSALTTLTNLASASGALFIIGIFLSLLALCFTSLAAYNKSKRIDPPQGSCGARSSHCAASVVPIVFAFIVRR